jgi:glycosyltransferase involved in cell wall biosynthesis
MGPLAGRKLKQLFIAIAEKHYLKHVNDIIVTGKLDEEILRNILGDKFNYHLIMNLPPSRQIIKSNLIRNQYNIPENKIILLYQGMLLAGRGIEAVIKALPHNTDLFFILLGSGAFRDKAINLAEELGVADRVILAGSKDYDQLHEWTCSADIGISLIEPITLSYSLALPNKMFEYIMAVLPVICTDLPAMKEIIDKYHVGECVPTLPEPKEIIGAITKIQIYRDQYIESCREASGELCFEKQINVFRELVK